MRLDARWFQIAFLAALLSFGLLARDFGIGAAQIALTFTAALGTQAAAYTLLKLPQKNQPRAYLSAVVSAFGISILVRSDTLWMHPLLACLAMTSKFTLRAGFGGQRSHIFNPANLAAAIAASSAWGWVGHAWLSPAQWGSGATIALWVFALGGLVTGKIGRRDISLTLLLSWGALLALRLWWLDYDIDLAQRMWLHQMGSGALLLYAFFMISDPMTTPQSRPLRITYAVLVALAAFVWQYGFFQPHGLILALFALSPLVPLLNKLHSQERFSWS